LRILIVDDHSETRRLLGRTLEQATHVVKTASSCADAEGALSSATFDVVVLDVMLPDGSGMDLCRRLRAAKQNVPILLLTARGEVRDRVVGLNAGADDYLVKPFALSELLARIRALSRRGPVVRDRVVAVGDVTVDFEARRVLLAGREVLLTSTEFSIVEVLASRRRGAVVSHDQLIESVWGDVSDSAKASLEVLVGRIRRKLGASARLLRTVRGVGYAFRTEE
jgi:DNA-binding response OmpR family regulator